MLTNDPELPASVREIAETTEVIRLSPISFFEVSQRVRLGKWPEMAPFLDELPNIARNQGLLTAPFSPEVAVFAGNMAWSHRDPFDRIIAATAMISGVALLSADTMFDTVEDGGVRRVG